MKRRTGFTLIELLIVVTIISILAGAAIPYVQDYLDESRRSRAKNDLDEIRNALVLYEVVRRDSYTTNNIASLVGPFLTKSMNDPWGGPYVVNNASSTVYSVGPDGRDFTGDEVSLNYRPRMAVTKVMWFDTDQDGIVNLGDSLHFYCTREIGTTTPDNVAGNLSALGSWNGTIGGGVAGSLVTGNRIASFGFSVATFTPGIATVAVRINNPLIDLSNNPPFNYARADSIKILAP